VTGKAPKQKQEDFLEACRGYKGFQQAQQDGDYRRDQQLSSKCPKWLRRILAWRSSARD
jgi:hypothetical protein